jgi:hypothetical protein
LLRGMTMAHPRVSGSGVKPFVTQIGDPVRTDHG